MHGAHQHAVAQRGEAQVQRGEQMRVGEWLSDSVDGMRNGLRGQAARCRECRRRQAGGVAQPRFRARQDQPQRAVIPNAVRDLFLATIRDSKQIPHCVRDDKWKECAGVLPAGQHQFADRGARFQPSMRLTQVGRIDGAQGFGHACRAVRRHRSGGDAIEDAALLGHVGGVEARAREHHFPVDADALGLVRIADVQRPRRLDDQADVALRRKQFADRIPVTVGVGEVERRIDLLEAQRLPVAAPAAGDGR